MILHGALCSKLSGHSEEAHLTIDKIKLLLLQYTLSLFEEIQNAVLNGMASDDSDKVSKKGKKNERQMVFPLLTRGFANHKTKIDAWRPRALKRGETAPSYMDSSLLEMKDWKKVPLYYTAAMP